MTAIDGGMKKSNVVIDDVLIDRLMAQVDADGLELLGPDGVLTELTSRILNRAMNHPGFDAHFLFWEGQHHAEEIHT